MTDFVLREMTRTIEDFETKMDTLFLSASGTKTLIVPFGHISEAAIHEGVLTPWRYGGGPPVDRDPSSYFSLAIRQHPFAQVRADDQLVVLGSIDTILPPEDGAVIPFSFVGGSDHYLRPVDMAIKAYWQDAGLAPAWAGIRDLTVTLVLRQQILEETHEGPQAQQIDTDYLSEYRGR